MKKLTKLLGIVLIIALVMSGTASAFAEDTGKITILNSEQNTVYNFYRILDLTGQDTSDPADNEYDIVAYSIAAKWVNFFKGSEAGASYLIADSAATPEQKSSLNQLTLDGAVYYLNLTEANVDGVVAFTNAAMTYAMHNNIETDATATGNNQNLVVTVGDLGYYLMIPVDASTQNANSQGSIASLTSTVPEAEIKVKAEKPKIEKVDDKISADVGQVVTYTITGTVPNTSGYETYKYVISDEMTSGLTFNKDVKVEIVTDNTTDPVTTVDVTSSTAITIDYTSKENAFTADFAVKDLQAYVGNTIRLTYTATVNDNAVSSNQEKNKATLKYGHNPKDLKETTPIEEEVYTAKIIVNKYTGDSATAANGKLAGAQFALMKIETTTTEGENGTPVTSSNAKFYKYTAAAGTVPAKVEWVAVAGAPTAGDAALTEAMAKALADAAADKTITAKTTDANGAAEFSGIADGEYYLVEFKAPDGYNRLDKPRYVKVVGTDADTAEGKAENKADATNIYDAAVNQTADIQNNAGTLLPGTGGIGTTIFYVVGSIMVVAAGVLLITKKRMGGDR